MFLKSDDDLRNAKNTVTFAVRFINVLEDKDWYGLQPDAFVFPVFCTKCKKTQPWLYHHLGSRYGQVSDETCAFCGEKIYIRDHDNIIDSISFNGEEVFFFELYKTHWKYLKQIEVRYPVSLKDLLIDFKRITMDEARDLIEKATGIKTTGNYRFITDKRLNQLPPTVNRWIEMLMTVGVENIYLEKKEA